LDVIVVIAIAMQGEAKKKYRKRGGVVEVIN
jgi:hypothetical protein